jgi:chemotaxis methyl-accepting protein methylase
MKKQNDLTGYGETIKLDCAKEEALTVIDRLLEGVYQYSGYDFREYKRGTVMRRLQRRLYATGASTYSEYMRYLGNHPGEYERLAEDLTIKVSSFMRSPQAFMQLPKLVLPELILHKSRQRQKTLRFWSAACAHGEEPYSIAIVLNEFLREKIQEFDVEIYATDISKSALNKAKAGIYCPKEVDSMFPALLKRYFIPQNTNYLVKSNIKRLVKFSHLDLVSFIDQPVVDVDCIFCCNILIIHEILEGLLRYQRDYFISGDEFKLKPLTRVELANLISKSNHGRRGLNLVIDVSRISRAIRGISVMNRAGQEIPVSFLLPNRKDMLKRFIKAVLTSEREDIGHAQIEKPYTDEDLRRRIRKNYSFLVTRREVAYCRKRTGYITAF